MWFYGLRLGGKNYGFIFLLHGGNNKILLPLFAQAGKCFAAFLAVLYFVKLHLALGVALPVLRCKLYNLAVAVGFKFKAYPVIIGCGTGNPFFTTDSAACLRGIEIEADVVLKATKVDGVFTADPAKDPTATMYEQLTYSEVLEKELKVMDLAAFTLARDHKLPIRVFNMNKPGALRRVVMGEKEGTLITE